MSSVVVHWYNNRNVYPYPFIPAHLHNSDCLPNKKTQGIFLEGVNDNIMIQNTKKKLIS